ncbi:MAG: hypothetical protein M1497_15255 [Nitrospirae bacterium]|nr:hypothetical protein [Nitrospirota bacterium]
MKSLSELLTLLRNRRTLFALGGIVLLVIFADLYVGRQQEAIIKEKEARIKRLEEQAFRMVSVDIRDITETGRIAETGRYEAILRVDNVGDEPVYLSHPHVKAYIQTGTISWTEVPVEDKAGEKQEQIYKIEQGTLLFRKILTVVRNLPYNRYLIPKYMHVRFYITLFVLPESGFKEEEVVERKSDTYIYLKPYWIAEREIAHAIDFGQTKVPIYMPISAFRNWNQAR